MQTVTKLAKEQKFVLDNIPFCSIIAESSTYKFTNIIGQIRFVQFFHVTTFKNYRKEGLIIRLSWDADKSNYRIVEKLHALPHLEPENFIAFVKDQTKNYHLNPK